MSHGTDTLLYHPNLSFNQQHMLISHCHIQVNAHIGKVIAEWLKLTIHEHLLDLKTLLGIQCPYLGKPLEYGRSFEVLEVQCSHELDTLTDSS